MLRKTRWILALVALSILASSVYAEEEELFKEFEIRVIRPRYFIKRHRFELGIQAAAIVNQTFYYTYLATAIVGFHFSEQFSLELLGAYGYSQAKEDQAILQDDFDIKTEYTPTQLFYGASFLWTPMYGKYQLRNGRLIYFDTFLSAGGGMIGILEKYDYCQANQERSSQVVSYPYFEFGIGQRFFISRDDSIRWDIKSPMYFSNTADSSCVAGSAGQSFFNQNINLQLGYSRFL